MYANKISLTDTFYKGDVVATPQGRGEIVKVARDRFTFPTKKTDKRIDARINKPAYIVDFGDRAAVYRAHNLETSSYEEEGTPNQGSGRALATCPYKNMNTDRLPSYIG